MTEPAAPRRLSFAIIVATAATTLAAGVTLAAIAGWLGPPPPTPALEPATPVVEAALPPPSPSPSPAVPVDEPYEHERDDDDHDDDHDEDDHDEDEHDDDDD